MADAKETKKAPEAPEKEQVKAPEAPVKEESKPSQKTTGWAYVD